jgi:hypothetical protein
LHVDGEMVDLQEDDNINTTESSETSTLITEPAASAALPVAAPVASESVPQSSKFCSECGAKISAKARSREVSKKSMTIPVASFEFRLNDDTCTGMNMYGDCCRNMNQLRLSTGLYGCGCY